MLRKLCVLLPLFAITLSALAQESRHFSFHYAFTVKNLSAGKKVRIWMPAAQSDAYQEVKVVAAKGDLPLKKTRESKFGNEIYFAETGSATQPELHFDVEYDVVRHERVALNPTPHLVTTALTNKERKEDLQPDALVPVTGLPAELAVKVTEGKTQPLDKARAIYDYVFTTMKYDKTGTGWGHGDVLYACDAKKGNCTDFHSLFIAMARSQGIPARFEIGFPSACRQTFRRDRGIPLLVRFLRRWQRMDSCRHLRSVEASGEARLFFRIARREPGAVQHGARLAVERLRRMESRSTILSIPTWKSMGRSILTFRWRSHSPTWRRREGERARRRSRDIESHCG